MKQEKIAINTLEYLADTYYHSDTTETEIRKENITQTFQQELKDTIKNKEVINIGIMGKVTSGKSTLMLELMRTTNEQILNKKMSLKYVAQNQYEFGRKTLQDYENIMLGIDEISSLETTGWNATIEQRYLEEFSDIQAQRYIHRIGCAPKGVLDRNADIILKVIGINRKKETTRSMIYYRFNTPTIGDRTQLIGYIDTNVTKTLHAPWYKKYRNRKFQAMRIKHRLGVFHTRDMHFAEVVLKAYQSVTQLLEAVRPNKDIIEAKIKRELQNAKIPITSLAIEHIKSEANALILQQAAIVTYRKKLQSKNIPNTMKNRLEKEMNQSIKELNIDIKRYQDLVKLNKDYESI